MDQQQETKEKGDSPSLEEIAREDRRLKKRWTDRKEFKQRHNWHPALLSPYSCKLSLTSHTLDEGKFVQRYSAKASERRQEVQLYLSAFTASLLLVASSKDQQPYSRRSL